MMFNRPEMIPSQRMLRQTAIQRLEQMRATAPNAKEAEDLLRCLVVFQSNIQRKDIIRIAPQGMDETARIKALTTLRYWGLLQRVSRHQYHIPDSLKRLFPPSQEQLERHYAHFLAILQHDWNVDFIRDRWPDISSALLWGIEHKSDVVLRCAQCISRHFRHPLYIQDWLFYLRTIEIGLLSNTAAMQALACKQVGRQIYLYTKDLATADEWYMQAFALYTRTGDKANQATVLFMRGRIAHQMGQFSTARTYYTQAVALYRVTNGDALSVLHDIFRLEVDDENLEGARVALSRILPTSTGWNLTIMLFRFAQLLRKKSYYEEARDTFARALRQAVTTNISQIYFAWGKMEHRLGNIQAGCNLCRLALGHTYPEHLSMTAVGTDDWERFVEIRAWLIDMGCDDV